MERGTTNATPGLSEHPPNVPTLPSLRRRRETLDGTTGGPGGGLGYHQVDKSDYGVGTDVLGHPNLRLFLYTGVGLRSEADTDRPFASLGDVRGRSPVRTKVSATSVPNGTRTNEYKSKSGELVQVEARGPSKWVEEIRQGSLRPVTGTKI